MELKYKKDSLAVIIPMYNEEKVAGKCIEEVIKVIKNLPIKTALFVINDGSSDNTKNILVEKHKIYSKYLTVISHKKNKGYGAATQTGITFALKKEFTWGLHMDSDLTNPPKFILQFIKKISDNVDCVKASRYVTGGKVINVPFHRKIISIVGNFFASVFFNVGIRDCTNGFRMVRLDLLRGIKFQENNFSIILEELYYLKKKGAKFIEIPNVLYSRTNSQSHFYYKPKIFYDYFKYALKASRA